MGQRALATPDGGTSDARAPSAAWLTFGFLAAPVAWLVHLVGLVALVPVACHVDDVLVLHVTTLLTAAGAVAGIVVAWRNRRWRAEGGHVHLLSVGGFWLGVLFLVLIVLEGLPVFALEPCE